MQQNLTKPLTSLPLHMLSEAQSFNSATKSSDSPTDAKGKAPVCQPPLPGLKTSVTTPVHPPVQPQSTHRVTFSIPAPPAPEVSVQAAKAQKDVDDDDDSFGFNADDATMQT